MAIAHYGTTKGSESNLNGSASTFSHDSGSGSDRCLVVAVLGTATSPPVTSVACTYNGVSVVQQGFTDSGFSERFLWFGVLANNQVASGSNTVSTTVTLSGGSFDAGYIVFASTFTGVDQANPVDATYQTGNANPGTTASATVTTATANSWVYGGMATQGAGAPVSANSPSVIPSNGSHVFTTFSFDAAVAYRGPETTPGAIDLGFTITSQPITVGAIAIKEGAVATPITWLPVTRVVRGRRISVSASGMTPPEN